MEYDVFISHASQDKQSFVEPLANALKEAGLRVWYDRFELRLGDSLREKIDEGLLNSRYGVVVLSKAFFQKPWLQAELDGLVTRQNSEGKKVILPIWHEVGFEDVKQFSPILAGKLAAQSSQGPEAVVAQILAVVKDETPKHQSVFQTDTSISLRERCLEVIRADDVLAWRALVDELTEPAPEELKRWKEERGEAAAHKGGDEWRQAFLEAVDICVPGFIPIITSIEGGRLDFWEESFRFVHRLAILSNETGGGARWTIYIGDSLLHIIGYLGMAMAVKTRQLQVVDRWMGTLIQDVRTSREVPWLKRRSAHFLPDGIKRDTAKPFALFNEVRAREQMMQFFPNEEKFEDCLFLANLLSSLVEFRGHAVNPGDLTAMLKGPRFVVLDVPPIWMMGHTKFQSLTSDLFGTSRHVFEYALPGESVDAEQFWLMWKQWKTICLQTWNLSYHVWPLVLDWLLLPGEPVDYDGDSHLLRAEITGDCHQ